MKRTELCLELRRDKRFLKFRQIRPGNRYFTLGSSRGADLRLMGEGVSGIHAVLQYKKDAWYLSDLNQGSRTYVGNEGVVEYKVEKPVEIRIGNNTINIYQKEINKELFQKEARDINAKSSSNVGHQVVIRLKGHVIESALIGENEPYEFKYGIKSHTLAPPKTKQWVWKEIGNLVVQQRLVSLDPQKFKEQITPASLFPPEMRKPLAAAVGTFLMILMIVGIAYMGEEKKEILPEKNPYTAMIYDAKIVQKKAQISKQASSKIMNSSKPRGPTPDPNAKTEVLAQNQKEQPSAAAASKSSSQKAIQQIRATGLAALVGRLSKRVAKDNSHLIKVNDGSAGGKGGMPSVRDIASLGTKINNTTNAGGGASTQRLAAVGTVGSGGPGSYKEMGKLTPGSVGTAEVGVIEEETDIQGGLDREVIAAYIQSQIGHIRYCYERQLSANPELYGKVKIQFMIGGTGKVVHQKVSNTTLNNAMVEACILKRVSGWEFPTPKGGTTVLVSYPFLFKSTQ